MKSVIKPWNDGGGSLSVAYNGDRDGSAVFTSDTNESIDRETSVSFRTDAMVVERNVRQEGMREVFRCADGDFLLADGGTFNVLKHELR